MLDKCLQCGQCCYLSFYDNKNIMNTNTKCRYLTENNLCSIYDNRPEWCLTAEKMEKLNLLPKNCGYKR